ncbi:MAG: SCO family protein [Dokdonella sp.]
MRESLPCLACRAIIETERSTLKARTCGAKCSGFRGVARALVLFAIVGLLLVAASTQVKSADLPGDSVYRLDIPLVDQDGRGSHFADHRGKPMLVSMFYSSCPYVCPMTIETLRSSERALSEAQRSQIEVLLVSFDPKRDDPPALKRIAVQHKVDTVRWTLARPDAGNVRKLAAVLDIQYRQLTDGDFNHSTSLILLDREGRIVARTSKLGDVDPEFIEVIRRVVGEGVPLPVN